MPKTVDPYVGLTIMCWYGADKVMSSMVSEPDGDGGYFVDIHTALYGCMPNLATTTIEDMIDKATAAGFNQT